MVLKHLDLIVLVAIQSVENFKNNEKKLCFYLKN